MRKNTNQRLRWTIIATEFFSLYIFWLILIGHYNIQYLLLGVLCCALVTYITHDLLLTIRRKGTGSEVQCNNIPTYLIRLLLYIPWIFWEIVKANIQLAYIILNPRLPINPSIIIFKTAYKWKATHVTLANSITLTPGTITILLKENEYRVHAIIPEAAREIENARLLNKAGAIFGEKHESPPNIRRIDTLIEQGE